MRPDLRYPRLWLTAGWLLICLVVISCLLPAPDIEPVARLLPDKAEHAIAFFGLTLWFCGLYARPRWRIVALGFLALGIGIEILQGTLTTTRSMDARDALADGIGILVGLLLARLGLCDWSVLLERLLPASPR